MNQSLLVYDGSNSLFRAAARAVTRRSDGVVTVPWDAEPVQAFLEAQFDARPFAFILVEGDRVHVGTETIGQLVSRMGLPDSLADALKRAYAVGGGPFGRVVHGRTVADIDGTFPLSPEAAAHLADLPQVRVVSADGDAAEDGSAEEDPVNDGSAEENASEQS